MRKKCKKCKMPEAGRECKKAMVCHGMRWDATACHGMPRHAMGCHGMPNYAKHAKEKAKAKEKEKEKDNTPPTPSSGETPPEQTKVSEVDPVATKSPKRKQASLQFCSSSAKP